LRSTPPVSTKEAPHALLRDPWELPVQGGVVPDEGSDSEEIPEGVQRNIIQLQLFPPFEVS